MVRGRRARPTKTGSVMLANGVKVASLVDDQHCASPKRKDCKIDASLGNKTDIDNISVVSNVGREKRTAAAAAAVYVRECLEMGQSKTRSQTIKHYCKTNSKGDLYDIPINTNGIHNHHHDPQDDHQLIAALSFDLSEEDTCNEIFGKYDVHKIQSMQTNHHNHHLRSSPINNTQNIFLQEPVLSLNVDKSPNQASSIKIKKSIEVEPVFSSAPMAAASITNSNYPIGLNGQFNKIVSLNTSPKRENSLESNASTFASSNNIKSPCNSYLLNIDNSSCDSGVAFIDNKAEKSPSRRRKPATPHRIVCPSPIKSCCVSRLGVMLPSPTKKIQITTTMASLPPYQNNAQRRHLKSRRRLNQQEYENKCILHLEEPQIMLNGGNSTSPDVEIMTSQSLAPIEGIINNSHIKSILNSAKNPTAEQNTNNNYKKTNNTNLATNTKIRLQAASGNTAGNQELTKFFPVRRSVRKTKTAVKEEMMRSLEKAILEERADGLKVIENFDGKGRGIIAERPFQRGEFVVEYIGDLINMTEANQREKKYALDENAGCYMYYFKHKNQQYCIDATAESGKLGRLVNHSRNGNLITKVVVIKNRPHLVLIAKDDIEAGEELCYDYGDRSKEALLHHPWLAF